MSTFSVFWPYAISKYKGHYYRALETGQQSRYTRAHLFMCPWSHQYGHKDIKKTGFGKFQPAHNDSMRGDGPFGSS